MNEGKSEKPATTPAPYEPPAVLFVEPLEVQALVCTPVPPAKSDPVSCSTGPISS
jgi:hypothetical protein